VRLQRVRRTISTALPGPSSKRSDREVTGAWPTSSRRFSPAPAPHRLRLGALGPLRLPPSQPEVEERFQRIEREYAARDRLLAHGLKPRRTVLLYGPPGCGKSLGAKRLAWNTGLPLMKVRFDSLLSSYFGESAANLRTLFDAAKDMPCVLLIDECDFIARSRANSRDVGEASRIVSSLLQLMEDYDAPGLLVATTNLEGSLDDALFRRFDDVFKVTAPGSAEIEQLLCITLSAMRLSDDVDMKGVVESLEGWPAAQVVRAARDAAKLAVLESRDEIQSWDLNRAVMALRPGTPAP
jgi:SpoVK/Ycf46/Vps4 family AAA+-type ATPase